jgi:hypothetical protein
VLQDVVINMPLAGGGGTLGAFFLNHRLIHRLSRGGETTGSGSRKAEVSTQEAAAADGGLLQYEAGPSSCCINTWIQAVKGW